MYRQAIAATLVGLLTVTAMDPRRFINLPIKKEALNERQVEKLRQVMVSSIFLMKLIMEGLVAYITHITIEVAMERAETLGWPFLMLIAAILILAAIMTWQTMRISRDASLV